MKFYNNKELRVGDKVVFIQDDEKLKSLYTKYGYSGYPSYWPNKYNGCKIVETLSDSYRKGNVIKRFKVGTSSKGDFATVFDFEIMKL